MTGKFAESRLSTLLKKRSAYMAMRRGSMSDGAGACAGSRMCAANALCIARVGEVSGRTDIAFRRGMRPLQRARVRDLSDELDERREIEIALDQRRLDAELRIRALQQPPHRIDH